MKKKIKILLVGIGVSLFCSIALGLVGSVLINYYVGGKGLECGIFIGFISFIVNTLRVILDVLNEKEYVDIANKRLAQTKLSKLPPTLKSMGILAILI